MYQQCNRLEYDMQMVEDRPVVEIKTADNDQSIVERARGGLAKVSKGEGLVEEGWLEYGAALNEGRERFPDDDKNFGNWKKEILLSQLDQVKPYPKDEEAAMWAAGNPDEYRSTKKAHPNVRTIRGLHAKWKKPAPKQPKPKMDKDDQRKVRKLQAVIDDPSADPNTVEACKRKLDGYKTAHGEKAVEDFIERAKEDEEEYELIDMEPFIEEALDIIFDTRYDVKWRKAQVQDWLEKAFDGDDNGIIAEVNFLKENKNDWT